MDKKRLLEELNDIDPEYILDAAPEKTAAGSGRRLWRTVAAAAAVLAVGAAAWGIAGRIADRPDVRESASGFVQGNEFSGGSDPAGQTGTAPADTGDEPFTVDYENAKCVGYHQVVDGYIRRHPDSALSQAFVASWITRENEYVIKLNRKGEGLEAFVREELGCRDTVFEYGEGNWQEAEKRYSEVGGLIYRFFRDHAGSEDEEVRRLTGDLMQMREDGQTGQLTIILYVSDGTAEYIREASGGEDLSYGALLALPEKVLEDERYKSFLEDVELFRKLITDREDLLYAAGKRSEY